MQQNRGGEGGNDDEMKPQLIQDHRRLKPLQITNQNQSQNQMNQPQQQLQKCPRCESLNTKFCYYNNYSLSQPRYFCKACRRYWTQGGTLRNVPVGGGCRKGKRAKTSSSSSSTSGESSRPSLPPPQPSPPPQTSIFSAAVPSGLSSTPSLRSIEPNSLGGASSYFPAGGYFSHLSALQQSFSQPQSLNQSLRMDSEMGLLQQQREIQASHQIYNQMGNGDSNKSIEYSFYPTNSSSQHDWPQSFISNSNPTLTVTDSSSVWTIGNSSTSGTNSNAGLSSLNPNQWPDDLSGYHPPP